MKILQYLGAGLHEAVKALGIRAKNAIVSVLCGMVRDIRIGTKAVLHKLSLAKCVSERNSYAEVELFTYMGLFLWNVYVLDKFFCSNALMCAFMEHK